MVFLGSKNLSFLILKITLLSYFLSFCKKSVSMRVDASPEEGQTKGGNSKNNQGINGELVVASIKTRKAFIKDKMYDLIEFSATNKADYIEYQICPKTQSLLVHQR